MKNYIFLFPRFGAETKKLQAKVEAQTSHVNLADIQRAEFIPHLIR